jgi:hypothetical protein
MSRAVRHLFACLLLVLLPFQALAASMSIGSAPVVSCAEQMEAGMDCCDQDSTTCPDASHCSVHAAIAVPLLAVVPAAFPLSAASISPVPSLHESYIPEGLQRPPQLLA